MTGIAFSAFLRDLYTSRRNEMPRTGKESRHLPLSFSLLWPEGAGERATTLSSRTIEDLGIGRIAAHLVVDSRRASFLQNTLAFLIIIVVLLFRPE